MQDMRSTAQEAAEDVFFGQVVINWARWFVIAAGVVLILLSADNTTKVVLGIIPVVGLMVMNFYLHGRRLAERPANRGLITLASLVDLAAITAVVSLWPEAQGMKSEFFIMYYPVVLAFAFVMPPKATLVYTTAALVAYAAACFVVDPDVITDYIEMESFVTRLITIGAMGALGAYYWRIQRNRRRVVEQPAEA